MPWDPTSFRKHNHGLNDKQARQAAAVANSVLTRTGNEGLAVREANGVIKREKAMGYGAKPKKGAKPGKPMPFGAKPPKK